MEQRGTPDEKFLQAPCPRCGQEVFYTFKYCPFCGLEVTMSVVKTPAVESGADDENAGDVSLRARRVLAEFDRQFEQLKSRRKPSKSSLFNADPKIMIIAGIVLLMSIILCVIAGYFLIQYVQSNQAFNMK